MGIKIDGEYINLNKIYPSNSWKYKNGHIVSYQNQPNELIITENPKKEIEIEFLNHEWSGKCKIISNVDSKVIDLYKNKESISSILTQADKQIINLYYRVIAYIGLIIIIYNFTSFMLCLMSVKSKGVKKLKIHIKSWLH